MRLASAELFERLDAILFRLSQIPIFPDSLALAHESIDSSYAYLAALSPKASLRETQRVPAGDRAKIASMVEMEGQSSGGQLDDEMRQPIPEEVLEVEILLLGRHGMWMVDFLRVSGFKNISTAENGFEALELMETQGIKVIIIPSSDENYGGVIFDRIGEFVTQAMQINPYMQIGFFSDMAKVEWYANVRSFRGVYVSDMERITGEIVGLCETALGSSES